MTFSRRKLTFRSFPRLPGPSRLPALAAALILSWAPPASPAVAPAEAAGKRIFEQGGCSACHGPDAQGTAHAPALPGHAAEQVKRYVRNPQGKMPRFGPDKLKDADLDAVAAYIAGLQPAEVHAEPIRAEQAIEMHHWMAHRALSADDAQHAADHLSHLEKLVKDEAHRRDIERLIALVRANRLSEAADGVVVMVSSKVNPEISTQQMHVRLALGSLEAGQIKDVRHHLEHYIESASAHDRRHAEMLLARLKQGDTETVRLRLGHLLNH